MAGSSMHKAEHDIKAIISCPLSPTPSHDNEPAFCITDCVWFVDIFTKIYHKYKQIPQKCWKLCRYWLCFVDPLDFNQSALVFFKSQEPQYMVVPWQINCVFSSYRFLCKCTFDRHSLIICFNLLWYYMRIYTELSTLHIVLHEYTYIYTLMWGRGGMNVHVCASLKLDIFISIFMINICKHPINQVMMGNRCFPNMHSVLHLNMDKQIGQYRIYRNVVMLY